MNGQEWEITYLMFFVVVIWSLSTWYLFISQDYTESIISGIILYLYSPCAGCWVLGAWRSVRLQEKYQLLNVYSLSATHKTATIKLKYTKARKTTSSQPFINLDRR